MYDIYQKRSPSATSDCRSNSPADTSSPASTPDAKAQDQEASGQECPALRSQQQLQRVTGVDLTRIDARQ